MIYEKDSKTRWDLVGLITKEISNSIGYEYSGEVYIAPGCKRHIFSSHKNEFSPKIKDDKLLGVIR